MMRSIMKAACGAVCLLGVTTTTSLAQQDLQQPLPFVATDSTAICFGSDESVLVSYGGEPAACGTGCEGGDPAACCEVCVDGACGDCIDGCCSACGVPKKPAKPNPCATSHKGLFYANDFSYLKQPGDGSNCLGDNLKLMPIGLCGCYGTLDVGGQVRLRYHSEEGMGHQPGRLGFQDTQNDFLLSRLRLYGDWKVNDSVRVFVEGIHAGVSNDGGNLYVPRPIDENYGDLLNAFVDVVVADCLTVRVGRQELLYGAQRTVSPLDWANTRRTFEGIRGLYKRDDWAIDVFYTNLVPVNDNQFDEANYDVSFYGIYSTYTGRENTTMDFYYLGYDNQTVGTPVSTDFSLHTFGSRVQGKAFEKWLYEVEAAYQGGRQSGLGQDHDAGFVTGGIGRNLNRMPWNSVLWAYLDYASGDSAGGDFNRYNQLFPLAHKYLGFIDAVARSNVVSPNVRLTMSPSNKLDLLMWYYYFGADSGNDTISGVAVPSAQRPGENDFGNELDLLAKYKLSPRSDIVFGYSHLWAGSKIIGTDDADFFYSQWTLNF